MTLTSFGKKEIVALLTLLPVGCSPVEQAADWQGTTETLPNGAVRVVNPAAGLWKENEAWRLVPEFSVGAVEGEDWEVFAAVTGLEANDEGRVFVLDRQTQELRIFSPDGGYLRSVGRSGSGPGEYINPNGLVWLSPDSLVVVDQRGNRFSVLTSDGEYVRSVPRQLGFYAWAFRGGLTDGRVFEFSSVPDGEDRVPALLSTPLRDPGTTAAASLVGDTVKLPLSDAPPYEGFSIRTDRGGMNMGVPFAPSSVYHLDEEGHLWHGHGSEFRLFRSTLVGDTILEILLGAERTPVSAEEIAEWEVGPGPTQFREMGGVLDMDRIPQVKPFFDGLYQDPEGYLWASVPSKPSETVFAIIDPEGKYLGRLLMEGFERVEWVDPVVRNGRLYLVGRDEYDVQHVFVFRIER